MKKQLSIAVVLFVLVASLLQASERTDLKNLIAPTTVGYVYINAKAVQASDGYKKLSAEAAASKNRDLTETVTKLRMLIDVDPQKLNDILFMMSSDDANDFFFVFKGEFADFLTGKLLERYTDEKQKDFKVYSYQFDHKKTYICKLSDQVVVVGQKVANVLSYATQIRQKKDGDRIGNGLVLPPQDAIFSVCASEFIFKDFPFFESLRTITLLKFSAMMNDTEMSFVFDLTLKTAENATAIATDLKDAIDADMKDMKLQDLSIKTSGNTVHTTAKVKLSDLIYSTQKAMR